MNKRNSLKTRLIVTISTLMVLMAAVITGITVYSLYANGEEEIALIRENELEIYKTKLNDTLDLVFTSVKETYANFNNNEYLEKVYGNRLKTVVDSAYSIIKDLQTQVSDGKISVRIAQSRAKELIGNIRYSGGTGYIWINDTGTPFPRMIMHPIVPALNGMILDAEKYNVVEGTKENLFAAMVKVCNAEGEGYVKYLWPKPAGNGLTEDQPKLSYVRKVDGWDWILGTGIYIDDAKADMLKTIKTSVSQFRYDNGTGYFFIIDTSKPFPKVVMHPISPALIGKIMDDPKYNVIKDTKENLFTAMVNICEKNGEGYVQYLWPKPTESGVTEQQPKLSYVRLFKPLNWIIGTGIYINDIEARVAEKQDTIQNQTLTLAKKFAFSALLLILIMMVILIFMINRITNPIIKTTAMLEELSKGEGDLTKHITVGTKDEIGLMADHFNTFISKLKAIINGMKSATVQSSEIGKELKTNTDQVKSGMSDLVTSSENVKKENEILNQELGESKTAVDEINEFLNKLVGMIESQSSALTEASAAIEEMAASIRSISNVAAEKKGFQTNWFHFLKSAKTRCPRQ